MTNESSVTSCRRSPEVTDLQQGPGAPLGPASKPARNLWISGWLRLRFARRPRSMRKEIQRHTSSRNRLAARSKGRQIVDDVDVQAQTVARLFASDPDEVPVELRERTMAAEQALADWSASVPADVVEAAAAAGFDLRSLGD